MFKKTTTTRADTVGVLLKKIVLIAKILYSKKFKIEISETFAMSMKFCETVLNILFKGNSA